MATDVGAILRDVGAMKEGHFLLSSGRHGDRYIEKFALLMRPRDAAQVCALIAERFADAGVETVAGPTTGGILMAFEIARQMGVRAVYAERADSGTGREFRRGATFRPGERVLVDRSGGRVDFGTPLFATYQTDIATYAPDDCPLCREGLPLVKPGTTVAPGGQTATA